MRPNPAIEIARIDGEIVTFDGERLNLLDVRAVEVFDLLDGERGPAEVAAVLAERYDVDPQQIVIEVDVLLADFAARGLLAG